MPKYDHDENKMSTPFFNQFLNQNLYSKFVFKLDYCKRMATQ